MHTHVTAQDMRVIYNRLKESAKKRGIPFHISISELSNISIPLNCPILGIPLAFNRGSQKDNSISFDRIDSSKGYTVDNLVVISVRANKLKSDATLEELQKIASFYTELYESTILLNDKH